MGYKLFISFKLVIFRRALVYTAEQGALSPHEFEKHRRPKRPRSQD